MAQVFETGHAKNVANFEKIINYCIHHDVTYNPSKHNIKIDSLKTILDNGQKAIVDVMEKLVSYNKFVSERQFVFKDLKKLSTRLINALSVTDANQKTIEQAKAVNKKIQGIRAYKKKADKIEDNSYDQNSNKEEIVVDKNISTSQQSYDQLIEHFAKLISILQSENSYNPNEETLKINTINQFLSKMKEVNFVTKNAQMLLSNSRLKRNEVLYNGETAMYPTSLEIKKYIKSVFGASSPQYKQISTIKLTIKS